MKLSLSSSNKLTNCKLIFPNVPGSEGFVFSEGNYTRVVDEKFRPPWEERHSTNMFKTYKIVANPGFCFKNEQLLNDLKGNFHYSYWDKRYQGTIFSKKVPQATPGNNTFFDVSINSDKTEITVDMSNAYMVTDGGDRNDNIIYNLETAIIDWGNPANFVITNDKYDIEIVAVPQETKKYTITQNLDSNITSDCKLSEIEEGKPLTITLTPNQGYKIKNISCNLGRIEDNKIIIDTVTDNVVVGATSEKLHYVSITGSFENCSCNYQDREVIDYNKRLEIKANEGYTFKDYFNFRDSDFITHTFTKTDTLQYFNLNGFNLDLTLNEKYVAYPPIKKYTITQNLDSNITSDCKLSEIEEGKPLTITLTPNQGYKIKNISCNLGRIEDNKIIIDTVTDNVVVSATSEKLTTIKISGSFENCSCNYSDGEIVDINSKPVEIKANEGFIFKTSFNYLDTDHTTNIIPKISDTLLRISKIPYPGMVVLNDKYVATQKTEKISQFVNVYKVNKDVLDKLSKKRFKIEPGEIIDYGQYMLDLYKLPFKIPSEIIRKTKTPIVLGALNSEIETEYLLEPNFVVSLGTIKIPEKYHNVYDYLNTECILHLPYTDNINLKTEYVVNQELKIEYVIDLYTGIATINIYSTFTNNIVFNSNTEVTRKIPFIQNAKNTVFNKIEYINNNDVKNPFIEVIRNIPYKTDIPGHLNKYDFIKNYKGYTKVNETNINTNATQEEQTEIKQLLSEGVIINENISIS